MPEFRFHDINRLSVDEVLKRMETDHGGLSLDEARRRLARFGPNVLTDIPEMTIATDRVDAELIDQPRRWDIAFIRRFMLTFGLVSSVFDYLTFGALLWILHSSPAQFRTGWLIESVISASAIMLVIRTRRPLLASRPSRPMIGATLAVAGLTLLLPYLPVGGMLGLTPMPPSFLLLLAGIVAGYVAAAEIVKRHFYAHRR